MLKTTINKTISLIAALLLLVLPFGAYANAEQTQITTPRISEEHPFISTVNCELSSTEALTLRVYVETNTNQIVDEVGYSSMKLWQYDEETESWIEYGSWRSLYNQNSQTYTKTSFKYVPRGETYKLTVTHYAKKYGTLFDEIDEVESESPIFYLPTLEEVNNE